MQSQRLCPIIMMTTLFLITVSVSSADDYFDQITVFSDGRITRFVEMPITVYIAPMPAGINGVESYLADLRYALRGWEGASEEQIQFREVTETDNADIRVKWQRHGLTQVTDTTLGKTELLRLSETDFEIDVILSLREKGSTALLSHEKMRTVCLHEFGHALGLWGHSPDPDDVLFFAATAQHPTGRDKATLLKVYASPLHAPQHDAAVRILRESLDVNPQHPRNHYLLGAVYFDKADMESAIASFKSCLNLESNFQQANEKLLQAYQNTGRQQEAIALLEKTLNRNASPEGYNTAGVLYHQNREIDKAVDAFKKAYQINPRYQPAKNNLYQLYREQGSAALKAETYPQAISYFSKALKLNPTGTTVYNLMGEVYTRQGDFQNAIAQYKKALQFDPGDTLAAQNIARNYNNLGVQLTQAQRWEEAIEAYHQAFQLMPDLASIKTNLEDVYWKRANILRERGETDKAIQAYRELLKFNAKAVDARSLLGELYLRKSDYPQAIAEFKAALEVDAGDAQARQNLMAVYHKYGQILDAQKRYREAIIQFQSGLALEAEHINLRLSLAYTYQHADDFEHAKGEFERILEGDSSNAQAKKGLINLHIGRGNYLMNRKKYTAALKEFESIPESDRNAGIYNTIGYLHLMKKQPLKALPAFDAALTEDAMNKVAYQNLLSIESRFERKLDGVNDSQLVKDNLARVRNSLVICLIGRNEHLKAKAEYRSALDLAPADAEIKAALIGTGIRLAKAFQKKKWPKNMKEVIRWIQEQEPENLEAKQLLE